MKTAAQKKADERARKRAAGLARLEAWAHPADHAAIKHYAAKKTKAREVKK